MIEQPRYGRWIRAEKRLAIYIRDNFSCGYCGKSLKQADPFDITLDHLVPRVSGGSNESTNLITACRACNCSRQDKPWFDYATGGARDRIEQLRHGWLNIALAKALIADKAGNDEVEEKR